MPFADVGPALIPEWMDDEDAVLLTDAVATGYFGAQLGDIAEGDVVTVFGAGPVGVYAAKSAWLMGAGRVIVIDHLEYRLEKTRTFAHAETYNFTEYDDIVVHMKKITEHLGADVVIDAVGAEADDSLLQHITSTKVKLQGGSPIALNWAIDSVRKGGTVSAIGAYGPMFSAVKFGDAVNKGLIRKYAYKRFSEARAAHWLLLLASDRVDAVESHLRSFATLRPDNPIAPTGVLSEFTRHGISSRRGQKRADVRHQALDPVIVAGPWVLAGWAVRRVARRWTRVFS
ncbi:MAG: Threonine dehydrogenase and related Zn-dependent dehydrogenases [uncultured Acidimicrobiales bacterium]|uniref:Threonine dehydrogenase and related Zn-dependent dehydrogenases n=1 Tax=uncultured Acidimicrobiales bacterium TaxID=310071 RepID=A0A6J4IGP7_9ACTN|nr:MAG: Threonine dehydrogenase and related Zn-dependent dehydrogenases [uncultured Acidimicrobiales bacterium]